MQSEVTEVTPFLRNLTAFLSLLILMSICLKTFLYLPQSQVVPVTKIVITNNNKNEENHFELHGNEISKRKTQMI